MGNSGKILDLGEFWGKENQKSLENPDFPLTRPPTPSSLLKKFLATLLNYLGLEYFW